MDNFRLDITSDGDIEQALILIARNSKVIYWKDDAGKRFLLAKYRPSQAEENGWDRAPYAMTASEMAPLVKGWLEKVANYGVVPDIDGDCTPAWRVYNEAWGHVDNSHAVFAAIEPAWSMHGK